MSRIVALCGGVGGAKLAYGLANVCEADELVVIVNTADDFEHLGLTICPDIDTVLYTLAGKENPEFGWGRAEESWRVMHELEQLGGETWFKLGDKDIALHLLRRQMLGRGMTLTEVTRVLAQRLSVAVTVLPMTDAPVRTMVTTDEGELPFQDYFVRRRCEPVVKAFRFAGVEQASPSPQVESAFASPGLRAVIICPSNPYVSVGPILALPGMKERLRALDAPVLAVSPIVGGRAIKGPAAKMMRELAIPPSALAVARIYGDLIDAIVVDEQDRALLDLRESTDPTLFVAQTVMKTPEDRVALGRECIGLIDRLVRKA
ncbi:MAG TPA: 2-phospho-L-lactate transferase [Burkholderiales bacterium]|nr:2-phospho-L-lactate transferase [Burkholderiales bacterium]